MAETSRSRVTITLGGSGQVVKRGGAVANSGSSHSQAALGSKRSVRDRLGSDVDGIQLNSKRQRGDSNGVDDARLGKDDLRFKLMRKNVKRRGQTDIQRNGVDLRETLSRAVRPPTTSLSMHQRLPEPMDSRYLVPERKDTSILGRIPPTRSADAFPRMDLLRNSYSPWTLDQLKKRSPDRVLRTSRNLSPQRNEEEITKRPLIRTNDEARTFSYMNRDILEPGRALGTAPYSTRTIADGASVKHGNEHRTVDGLLHYLGLEKYAISFKAEEVDMAALKQMGDSDLKALGIPMGPRKKILFALLPRSKRPSG
ncbi:uncharacterized protein LOC130780078 isoform X2 [Actinidia eriantha]|uniref:uncharacterized protein LOC130780078 isoform X2 n=1 Tax=Actinidia eriantha TaxID=165200 RepID=UPI002585D576|nr:uncharacterized protein LOC130780078 isoform X2 [Actinidia eriantha]